MNGQASLNSTKVFTSNRGVSKTYFANNQLQRKGHILRHRIGPTFGLYQFQSQDNNKELGGKKSSKPQFYFKIVHKILPQTKHLDYS